MEKLALNSHCASSHSLQHLLYFLQGKVEFHLKASCPSPLSKCIGFLCQDSDCTEVTGVLYRYSVGNKRVKLSFGRHGDEGKVFIVSLLSFTILLFLIGNKLN